MQQDVDHAYQQYFDHSHHGYPSVIESVHTGQPEQPAYHINLSFLQWAYTSHHAVYHQSAGFLASVEVLYTMLYLSMSL